jgi:hypothetical protein
MAIREQVEVELATVEVNDDYRVEVTQLRKVVDYSPDQATELANEIADRAADARMMLAEHLAEVATRAQQSQPVVINGSVVL